MHMSPTTSELVQEELVLQVRKTNLDGHRHEHDVVVRGSCAAHAQRRGVGHAVDNVQYHLRSVVRDACDCHGMYSTMGRSARKGCAGESDWSSLIVATDVDNRIKGFTYHASPHVPSVRLAHLLDR